MASTVEASHLPLGLPSKEPSLARAAWISEIRSGAGAFCPRTWRVVFFVDLVWCVLEPDLGFEELVPCPFATAPVTPIPAATSSVRARWVAFGTRIGFRFCASGDASVSPVLLLLAVR